MVFNPLFNRGPLFFRQERLGLGMQPFKMWKFRTMTIDAVSVRGHDDGVEQHRVTRLGRILRKLRLDEVPNFINVMIGEMSVIGPRPDMADHARAYTLTVPRYRERFRVKPGITGLAQVRHGYAENTDAVLRKARNDQIYIDRANVSLDLNIVWQTVKVMRSGFGAR